MLEKPGRLDEIGLVTLPSGARVRGRRLSDPASPADFALVLADGPLPPACQPRAIETLWQRRWLRRVR